ncbi:MAG: hypothetical protein V4619_05230 [Bacteroidota bacterium]
MTILFIIKGLTEDNQHSQGRKGIGWVSLYVILLINILIKDLTGQDKILKTSRLTGGISIIISLVIFGLYMFYHSSDIQPLALPFAVMAIFLGLFDVMNVHRRESNY